MVTKAFFDTLSDSLKTAINKSPRIMGIGPSAWPRIVSAYYFPDFKTISYNDAADNEDIAKELGVEVFSLKKQDPYIEVSPETPGSIIDTDLVKTYLAAQDKDFIFLVYKSSTKLEKVCSENNWRYIGNPKALSLKFENKKIFKEVIREIGIEAIPGDNILIKDLTPEKLQGYQKEFGTNKIVLQLAEVTTGGGSGTVFIDDGAGLKIFHERVEKLQSQLKKKVLETVNVAPFINGVSSSVSCCVTKKGVLTGPIQTQIIDIAEVGTKLPGRSGNYAGADWSVFHFSQDSQRQASTIAEKFGEYMYKEGYKGIFGIDLLVEENGKVWPVECNPRDTDAFPMISMFMMQAGCVPLDVFHNLEHIGVDYDFDFEQINQSYKNQQFNGSQIIIHNREEHSVVATKSPLSGIYKFDGENIVYDRPGFAIWDLENDDEYLLTENIQKQPNKSYDSHSRIGRLISRRAMIDTNLQLTELASKVIDLFYKQFGLVKSESGLVDDNGIKSLFVNKAVNAKGVDTFMEADIVNAYALARGGFRRPYKIAWRMKLDPTLSALEHLSTKQNQSIRYDLQKITQTGIKIDKISRINNSIYQEWLELYKQIINSKEKGVTVIDKNWFEDKYKQGKEVGAVLAYKDGKLLGGNLLTTLTDVMVIGYGVAQRLPDLRGGLGLLLDYYSIEMALEQGFEQLSFGKDDNLYGAHLSVGLLKYKTKLWLTPKAANKTYWLTTFFKNFDKFENEIAFLAQNEAGELDLVVIYKDTQPDIQKPKGVNEVIFYKSSDIIAEHLKVLVGEDDNDNREQ